MKKMGSILLSLCLIMFLLLSMPMQALAANELELSTGGSASKVTYSQANHLEEIRIYASSTQIVKQYVIPPEGTVTYYRIGFEIANVSVPKTIKFDVNKGTVGQVRLANLSDPIRTSVVIETTKKPEYTLTPAQDGKSVVLSLKSGTTTNPSPTPSATPSETPKPSSTPIPSETPKPSSTPTPVVTPKPSATPVATPTLPVSTTSPVKAPQTITRNGPLSWALLSDTCVITLDGISLSQTSVGNTPRFELRENEKIIQITLPGKDTRFTNGFLSGNAIIYGILVNYNAKQDCTLIRISYPNTVTFSHSINNGSSVLQIKAGKTSVPVSSNTPLPSSSPVPSVTPSPSASPAPSATTNPGNLLFAFNPDSVEVSAPNLTGSKVYRLGNPSRIVMEFAGTAAPSEKIMQAGSLYSRAVVSQPYNGLVRVELFTDTLPDWTYSEGSGKGTLLLSGTKLTNIQGGNGNGVVALRLVSPGIVNRYRQYMDSITLDDSVANSTFTYMIPTNIVNLGDGTAKMEDGLSKSIVTFTTAQSSFLLINKTDPNTQFKVIEGSSADELLIVVSTSESGAKPSQPNGPKLVVLDPGHGGSDPGAVIGSYYEKTYNLDIALRCESILKAKGINVVLTRTTDVFVGLEERAKFANDLNATLFVSIHNNSMPAGYKGSMTLYYPSSYDGKAYAQIIQNNMIRDLKTNDLGLRARGDVVVLKKTTMPAVLAEVACMSDTGDMALLNTSDFVQKSAETLAESIIQILNSRP